MSTKHEKDTLELLRAQNATLLALIESTKKPEHKVPASAMHVAIRNVSSYTIGLPGEFGAGDVDLHPAQDGIDSPATIAVISYVWWQKLRKGRLYGEGLIVRDDTRLDPSYVCGPADRPEDLHPDHGKNVVEHTADWIANKTEAELRDAIAAMTSERTLRRLWAAVDLRFAEELLKFPKDDPARVRKAERNLPSSYQLLETLVQDRIEELNPLIAEERAKELAENGTHRKRLT